VEYAKREIQEEEEWIDEHEWLQAEWEEATRVPSGAAVMMVDAVSKSIETELAHRSRQDS